MQSLMFLACFVQKVSNKNLWGSAQPLPPPPLGKGRVKMIPLSITWDQPGTHLRGSNKTVLQQLVITS